MTKAQAPVSHRIKKRRRPREEDRTTTQPINGVVHQPDLLALQNQIGNRAVQRLLVDKARRPSQSPVLALGTQVKPNPAQVMQPPVSNRLVQRYLQALGSIVQRTRDPRRPVPALANDLVVQVEDELAAGRAQAAINLVVNAVASQGRIDLTQLDGGIMRYDSSMGDEGHTTGYWDKDPARHPDAQPLPAEVKIGPPALASVPWLYSAVIHEWRHVQQFRVHQPFPERSIATEVDAYLHNIEQAWASGQNTDELLELWRRLNEDWWKDLTDPTVIAAFLPRYNAAKAYVEGHVASGPVKRPYQLLLETQIFFATGSAELDSVANDEIALAVEQVQDFLASQTDADVRFTLTGFASPRWKHLARGAAPADLNQALSEERVKKTQEQLRNAFRMDGSGACDFRVQTCVGTIASTLNPAEEAQVHGAGSAAALAEGRGNTSDEQQDRRVDIRVEYSPGPAAPTRPPALLLGAGGTR